MNKTFGHYPDRLGELHQCWLNYCEEHKNNEYMSFGLFMRLMYVKDYYDYDFCKQLTQEEDDIEAFVLCGKQIEKENNNGNK